ncbi:PREDICTED: uncharacterized protein LOC108968698, partial [Bactrocera latifrons]|uniref:uncharacterized protein LOC108968698 n=1 Tax=Bactrocera latifrons TaxID=174628 RepID=UPI0008DDE3FD
MTEDILHQVRRITANPNLNYTDELYNEALIKIEDFCLMIANKTLSELGMIAPNRPMHDAYNAELRREKEYDRNDLNTFVTTNLPKLNTEQRQAYDTIIDNVANERGGIFFLDAPGGTGKTFLLSLILATIRSQNNIALALASSGIAATLLDGGRTAHSALKLPLNMQLQNDPTAAEFSEHLLQIGNGRKPIDKNTGMITLPTNFCTVTESRVQLVQNVFPNIAQNYRNQDWLSERAILAAKNVDVNEINASILTQIPGEVVTYKSIDSITNPDDVVNYPIEFLNSLNLPGLPPHRLQLKVGAVIIMLRNINQPKLCNGTRLAVKRTMNN